MKKTLFLTLMVLFATGMGAQTFSPERTGGIYYAYPVSNEQCTVYKEQCTQFNYQPFYISHYGRHGSRWLPSEERYNWVMAWFQDKNRLTSFGKSVRQRLKKICRNARGNAGALTSLGAAQHRGIARRMVQRFPEFFGNVVTHTGTDASSFGAYSAAGGSSADIRIQARSSTSPRCRASMLAFCDELEQCTKKNEHRPLFTIETTPAHMAYINHESAELKALSARTKVPVDVSTGRFLSALFKDPSAFTQEDATKLLSELHTIASDMQDIPLDISLWDCFTEEEMLAVHDANNERMTICNGDTIVNDGIPARSSIALWQNIVAEADSMITAGGRGASLRFGHDTALFRLLTLLRLQLPGTGMEDIVPMAANLQIVFFSNGVTRKDTESSFDGNGRTRMDTEASVCSNGRTRMDTEDVFVMFMLNEQPCALKSVPIRVQPLLYKWSDVKEAMEQRIHHLEHQRQLTALNTMVGTAPANTQTAGLFGKGSEEHGQTLPAVLVPNGQTFWTPQTRDTEKKCIAPYYYQDTLFQGIRASHWLVGGCTQDYGSFTITAQRSLNFHQPQLPQPSHFSHSDEISHPHYYAVTLPSEHLRMELTGLSHTAMLRVTPLADGPVTIVVTANSDEEEGGAVIDGERHEVYGYNPVHRIYQGWGERAGFSGHFVLRYDENPIAAEEQQQTAILTFNGRKGKPIVLRMATSFTGRNGAEQNLQAEAISLTFEQMEQRCLDLWTHRLHAIDIDDPDTLRVNQFYGALYRASFLPREMSDVDGGYPRFNPSLPPEGGRIVPALVSPPSGGQGGVTRYGDFSLWDTYRALHPLLCIIAPEESGQMMQSLVGMAEEGGWMPIFPCWNSYTAAMIGDHASSVLADACVKGIRGFDVAKAYRFLRKNAFEKPATFEDYQNGMGRRALDSYLKYGYIPLEDSVKEAFHQQEQTSRTLEYAYDDFCVAQLGKRLQTMDSRPQTSDDLEDDYMELMRRSENWRNVINPKTGWADGRFAPKEKKKVSTLKGAWLGNTDLTSRQPYITEGAVCHYTWYVPQNIPGLIELMGGSDAFTARLDSMFSEGRYWHGNEPCHQVAWLYSLAGRPERTHQQVTRILQTEYNDTPGGLSGNDDAGQMSAWQVFAHLGFYPVCPGIPQYVLGGAQFNKVTLNRNGCATFVIRRAADGCYRLNGKPLQQSVITHDDLLRGGELELP